MNNRLKKVICALSCMVMFLTSQLTFYASGSDIEFTPELCAEAAYIVNENTGKVVYEKNADKRVAPASTTKIMTAALAMELCEDLDNTIITVPYGIWTEFEGIDISNAGLKGGEEMTMRNMLACMLIQSANEAASTVAAYFGREEFLNLMNEKARELGCKNTHFSNPHGLDADDHYSSARDLYIITKWALTHEGFMDIVSQSRYTVPETNKSDERILVSTNRMQDSGSGYYTSYIKGIKTGTTDNGGRCLITSAEKDGYTYISVLLGCPHEPDTRVWGEGVSTYTDARILYEWCFDNLYLSDVAKSGTPIEEVALKFASDRDYLVLYSSQSVYALLDENNEEDVVIRYDITVPEFIETPVAVGTVYGTADVYCDEVLLGTVELVAAENIEKSYFIYIMDCIAKVLTSTPALAVYGLLFIVTLAYSYYVFAIIPRKYKKKTEDQS